MHADEFTSEQWLFYGLHHLDVGDDGLAPSTDALYLWLQEVCVPENPDNPPDPWTCLPGLGTLVRGFGTLGPNDFVVVYGANHKQTGKAMYTNVSVYGMTKQVAADAVNDPKLLGSAADYLGPDYPDVDNYFDNFLLPGGSYYKFEETFPKDATMTSLLRLMPGTAARRRATRST
jgi:hypothetical protein